MRSLCWYPVFGFRLFWCCALWPNISTLVLSFQRTLFQKSWWFVQMQLSKPKLCCMLFLERRGFLLQAFLRILVQPFSNCSLIKYNYPGRGRLATVLSVFRKLIISLSVEWWTPNCLEMTLQPFPHWWADTNALLISLLDVFPPSHCVNTHLNAPDQQTD